MTTTAAQATTPVPRGPSAVKDVYYTGPPRSTASPATTLASTSVPISTLALCASQWVTGPWSSCNATCGRGVTTRNTTCTLLDVALTPVDAAFCSAASQPIISASCYAEPCPTELSAACISPAAAAAPSGKRRRLFGLF